MQVSHTDMTCRVCGALKPFHWLAVAVLVPWVTALVTGWHWAAPISVLAGDM